MLQLKKLGNGNVQREWKRKPPGSDDDCRAVSIHFTTLNQESLFRLHFEESPRSGGGLCVIEGVGFASTGGGDGLLGGPRLQIF